MAKADADNDSSERKMKHGHKVKGLSGSQKGTGHAEMSAEIHGIRTDKEKSMHTTLSSKTHKHMHQSHGGHHSGNKRGY